MGFRETYVAPLVASFWRAKGIAILYCASAVLGIAFLGVLMFFGARDHAGLLFQTVLMMSLPFTGLLLFVSCAITAFEMAKQVFGRQRLALFRLRTGAEARVIAALVTAAACLWGATLAVVLALAVVFSRVAGLSAAEGVNVVQFVVLRLGGATLVATLLGLFLGKTVSRTAGYSVMMAMLVLVSPVIGSVVGASTHPGSSYAVRAALYWALIAPFDLTAPMYNSTPDTMYLIPCEPHQWLLPAVWIASVLVGLVFSTRRNSRVPIVSAVLAFVLMIVPWAAYGARIALPRMSAAPHDITGMSLMPDILAEDAPQEPDVSAWIPAVDEYKLDLRIGSMLSGTVTVVLEEPFGDQPVFTLFRGYRVNKVTDGEGRSLDFLQDGDHVTILTPAQDNREFVFEYSGSGWGHYANHQAIFLSGSVPWYPWPGKQRFYWSDARYRVMVSYHIPRRGAVREMRVRVRSPFADIYTPQGVMLTHSDSFVSVPTESLTLMAGQVGVVGDTETFMVYGGKVTLDTFKHPAYQGVDITDAQTRQDVLDEARALRKTLGLGTSERLDVRTIVLVPAYPAYNNLYMFSPVYHDTYVLVPDGVVTDYSVVLALQGIPQVYEKRDLYECLYLYLTNPEDFLAFNPGMGREAAECDVSSTVGNLFADLLRDQGEEYVLSQVAGYLSDQSRTESGEEFLSGLAGGGQNESQ